jgi:hypothetical protein
MRRPILTSLIAWLSIAAASPVAPAGPWELEDVVGQGPGWPGGGRRRSGHPAWSERTQRTGVDADARAG